MILMIPKINFPNENDNRFPKLASNSLFAANLHPLVDSSPLTVVQYNYTEKLKSTVIPAIGATPLFFHKSAKPLPTFN